jgi:hypothetical protein
MSLGFAGWSLLVAYYAVLGFGVWLAFRDRTPAGSGLLPPRRRAAADESGMSGATSRARTGDATASLEASGSMRGIEQAESSRSCGPDAPGGGDQSCPPDRPRPAVVRRWLGGER